MKFTVGVLFLVSSAFSFAAHECSEPDSKMVVNYLPNDMVHVTYAPKGEGHLKTFKGKKVKADSSVYYKVSQYDLKSSSGDKATLEVSSVPVMTRVPVCTGRRVCDDFFSVTISAELDMQGKVVDYDCKESI